MSARSLVFSLVACIMSEASVHQKSCFSCNKTLIFDKASFADKGANLHRHASQYLFSKTLKYVLKAFKGIPKQGMPNVQKKTKMHPKRVPGEVPRRLGQHLGLSKLLFSGPGSLLGRSGRSPGGFPEQPRRLPALLPGLPGLPGPLWDHFGYVFGCISGLRSKVFLSFWEVALLVCLLRFLSKLVLNQIRFEIKFGFRSSFIRDQGWAFTSNLAAKAATH